MQSECNMNMGQQETRLTREPNHSMCTQHSFLFGNIFLHNCTHCTPPHKMSQPNGVIGDCDCDLPPPLETVTEEQVRSEYLQRLKLKPHEQTVNNGGPTLPPQQQPKTNKSTDSEEDSDDSDASDQTDSENEAASGSYKQMSPPPPTGPTKGKLNIS